MRSKATAGQSNLTLQICRDMPMPLCSLDEQREIVLQGEQLFHNADTAVRYAAEGLRSFGCLRLNGVWEIF
jgi:type I restriction enzyme S subunit